MKIENKLGLPLAYVRAAVGDYDMGDADISVTSLVDSPRRFYLRKRHDSEIVLEAADLLWRIFGSAVHDYLHKFADPGTISEERLYVDINGWKISGKPDNFDLNVLDDWKTVSIWTILFDIDKPEYIAQLNIYRYMAYKNGFKDINKLRNIYFLRDWHYSMHQRDPSRPEFGVYPPHEQEVWPIEEAERYLKERVSLFQGLKDVPDDDLPVCTPRERWYSDEKWALMKKGNKRATLLCETEAEAKAKLGYKGSNEIVFRPGMDKRCVAKYCEVCNFCSYYKSKQENQNGG